jgi:flagellar basal body-associated protein FliL
VSIFKHDSIIRHKLDGLNEMPGGVYFDASGTWQQVETKLQPRTKRKAMLWVSVAAVLLLAVLSAIIFTGKKVSPGITTRVAPVDQSHGTVQVMKRDQQTEAPFVNHQPTSRKNEMIASTHRVVENTINDTVTNQRSVVIAEVNTEVHLPDPLVTVVVTTPQVKKKRLKVIHLDELYQPVAEDIVKAEIKRKADDYAADPEPVITTPSKPFWKSKAPPKIPITITDNQ